MVFALPTRNITTVGSASEEASHPSDVPQRIKFKRLDKTARHIMQALIVNFHSIIPSLVSDKVEIFHRTLFARYKLQIVDKEAVEEVKSNREIPDVRPGCIVQLRVVLDFPSQ